MNLTIDYFKLNNNQTISRFFQENRDVAEILRENPPSVEQSDSWTQRIGYLTWFFFLKIAGYLSQCLCARSISRRCFVYSAHAHFAYQKEKLRSIFQNHLLAYAPNAHRKDTADFYLHPNISVLDLSAQIEPFQKNGLCRGMCLWFAQLYYQTMDQFPNRDDHIRAIGKRFELGANRQAAFLQAMNTDTPHFLFGLLPLQVQRNRAQINPPHDQATLAQQLRELPIGVYGIYTSNHMMLWIQEGQRRQFLFNPGVGTLSLPSPALLEKGLEDVLSLHDPNTAILIDQYSIF